MEIKDSIWQCFRYIITFVSLKIKRLEDIFKFKTFSILQKDNTIKVNQDGILLGTWVDVESDESILDIGTGTGVIAIIVATVIGSQLNQTGHPIVIGYLIAASVALLLVVTTRYHNTDSATP